MSERPERVVLTGFMGTGKTTVGRALAQRLEWQFVDTDELIVERHGSIADIFVSRGEPAFREIEREVAAELAARTQLVISTGGGLMLDATSSEKLRAASSVFCLTAAPGAIAERVSQEMDSRKPVRPLLADIATGANGKPDEGALVDRIGSLLAERAQSYARFEQVPTDDLSAEEVALEIERRLTHV